MPSEFDALTTPDQVLNFALAFVLKWEKGFQNDPYDAGNWTGGKIGAGENKGTNFGISAASYPTIDIKNLTLDQATAIYARDFWAPIHGNVLPARIAVAMLDAAVNSGVGGATRFYQLAAGLYVDGSIGPQTLAHMGQKYDDDGLAFCNSMIGTRLEYDSKLPQADRDLIGWEKRIIDLCFYVSS